ncbi:hypothetical protein NQZ79_g2948 [Umbelopsis isabellina]|nr:hypothetical protein NQZ79_g2948 [Umbelopsis isabellina]
MLLTKAQSLDLSRIKTVALQLLPSSLGKNAIVEAELEVKTLTETEVIDYEAYERMRQVGADGHFPLQNCIQQLRDRCLYYSTLAERDADQNADANSDKTMISPILAIYVTTIIEHLAEYLLTTVAVAAENEDTEFVRVREVFTALVDDTHVSDSFSKMELKERLEKRLVASGFRLKRPGTPITFTPVQKPVETKRQDLNDYEFEDDDEYLDSNGMTVPDKGSRTPVTSMLNSRANTGSTYRPTSVLSSTPSSLTVNSAHGSINSKKTFKLFNKNNSRHSVDFHSFDSQPTVYDPEAPGLNFEDLIRSGSTMKMSLTPNRLRSIEVEDQASPTGANGDNWARKLPSIRPESPRARPKEQLEKKNVQRSLPNNNGSNRPPNLARSSSFSYLEMPVPSPSSHKPSSLADANQKPALSTMFDLPLDFLANPASALPPSPKQPTANRNKPQPQPFPLAQPQPLKQSTEPPIPKPASNAKNDVGQKEAQQAVPVTTKATSPVINATYKKDVEKPKEKMRPAPINASIPADITANDTQSKRLPSKPAPTTPVNATQSERQEIVRNILQEAQQSVKADTAKTNPPHNNEPTTVRQENKDLSETDAPIRPPRQKPVAAKITTPVRSETNRASSDPITNKAASKSEQTLVDSPTTFSNKGNEAAPLATHKPADLVIKPRSNSTSNYARKREPMANSSQETLTKTPISLTNVPPSKFEAAKTGKRHDPLPRPKPELPKSYSEDNIVAVANAKEPEKIMESEERPTPVPSRAQTLKEKAIESKTVARPSEASEERRMSRPATPDRRSSMIISPERPSSIVAKRRSMSGTLPVTDQPKLNGSVEKSVKVWDDYLNQNANHTIIRRRSQIRPGTPTANGMDEDVNKETDDGVKETKEYKEYRDARVPVIPQGVLEKVRKFERQRQDFTMLDSTEAVKQARERIAASRKAVRMSLYRTVAVDASTQTDLPAVDQGVQAGDETADVSEIADSEVSERGVIDGDEEWFMDEWDEEEEDESTVAEWLLSC